MNRQTPEIGGGTQPQVFVSYARQDAEQVLTIARLLEAEGATVWRDEERILGGQYYGEEIVHAIAHSRVVMLMCSPHAFQSDNVHTEVLLTWDHYHRRYIPVWLCPPTEIPERFRYCFVALPVDRRTFPTAGALAAATAQGVRRLGRGNQVSEMQPDGSTPEPSGVPLESSGAALRFHPGTGQSRVPTGSWSGFWEKGALARSGKPATPICAACRR